MKTNKLLLGLFCMSALLLSACQSKPASSSSQGSEAGSSSSESGSSSSSSSSQHEHEYVFDRFIWTENPGAYTAMAHLVCSANDGASKDENATVTKDPVKSVEQDCEVENAKNVWVASYEGHTEEKEEALETLHHQWQTPSWNWEADLSEATAHFVCERNSDHTLDVKATKAQSTITEKERHEPSCGAAGDIVWEAVVEVGGEQYKSERTEPLPATGAHSPDEYGVCDVCHQYTGETKDLNTSFAVDASGEFFFRVPIIKHAHYVVILSDNNLQGINYSKTKMWLKVNDELQEISNAKDAVTDEATIASGNLNSFPSMIKIGNETGDGYLYVKLEEADNSGLVFDMKVSDECLFNAVGLCVSGDHYNYDSYEEGQQAFFGEDPEDGEHNHKLVKDEIAYARFEAYAGHTYTVNRGNNQIQSGDYKLYYQNIQNGQWVELERTAGRIILPNKSVFGELGYGWGYVYAVVKATGTIYDGSLELDYYEHPAAEKGSYGFCECDEYLGTNLIMEFEAQTGHKKVTGINIESGKEAFFRVAYEYGSAYKAVGDGEIITSWIKMYVKLTNGNFVEQEMSETEWLNYEASEVDGWVYFVVTVPDSGYESGVLDGAIDFYQYII